MRILQTSAGVTTRMASVRPEARPAVKVTLLDTPNCDCSISRYHSKDTKRIAIFGMIPVYTAVKPLYRARNPSLWTMRLAVPKGPSEAVTALWVAVGCTVIVALGAALLEAGRNKAPGSCKVAEAAFKVAAGVPPLANGSWSECFKRRAGSCNECLSLMAGSTNECRTTCVVSTACRLSCIRVLMVSKGWQTLLSTRPAHPPAIKCCRGGFFLGVAEVAAGADAVCLFFSSSDAVMLNITYFPDQRDLST